MDSIFDSSKLIAEEDENAEEVKEWIEENIFTEDFYLFKYISRAYNENDDEVLIILLNAYFESLIESEIERYYSQKDLDKDEISFQEKMRYAEKLDLARKISILPDEDYHTLKQLNSARNNYLHDLQTWKAFERTEIEEQDKLDESFSLYKRLNPKLNPEKAKSNG